MINIDLRLYATSVTGEDGKFHPAVSAGGIAPVHYWPNVKFATEQEAYEHASLAVKDALDAANSVAQNWNVVKL